MSMIPTDMKDIDIYTARERMLKMKEGKWFLYPEEGPFRLETTSTSNVRGDQHVFQQMVEFEGDFAQVTASYTRREPKGKGEYTHHSVKARLPSMFIKELLEQAEETGTGRIRKTLKTDDGERTTLQEMILRLELNNDPILLVSFEQDKFPQPVVEIENADHQTIIGYTRGRHTHYQAYRIDFRPDTVRIRGEHTILDNPFRVIYKASISREDITELLREGRLEKETIVRIKDNMGRRIEDDYRISMRARKKPLLIGIKFSDEQHTEEPETLRDFYQSLL